MKNKNDIFQKISFMTFLMCLFLLGCSGKSLNSPILSQPLYDNSQNDEPSGKICSSFENIGIIGGYGLKVSRSNLKAELFMNRKASIGESYIVNGKAYFTIQPAHDCLKISSVALNENHQVVVGFKIKHPFPKGNPEYPPSATNRLDLDILDVALLLKPLGVEPIEFDYVSRAYYGVVDNVDGYTAELVSIYGRDDALPYVICYKSPNNNRFEMGTDYQPFDVVLNLDRDLEFEIYLTFAYGASAKRPTRLNPTYYIPEFNRKAAWKVEVEPVPLRIRGCGSNTLTIKVYDWNHGAPIADSFPDPRHPNYISSSSDVYRVYVESQFVPTGVKVAELIDPVTNGWDDPLTYSIELSNDEDWEAAGTFLGLVQVVDARSLTLNENDMYMIDSPDGKSIYYKDIEENISTYQIFPIIIESDIVEVTPPWLNSTAREVRVNGNYAYVMEELGWLHTYDINDPLNPVWLNRIKILWEGGNNYIETSGNYLFAASDGDNNIKILDISSPANPQIFKIVYTPSPSGKFKVLNGFAYIVNCAEMVIVDVDPPQSAHCVKTLSIPNCPVDVDVANGYAYLTCNNGDLKIVDIDPINSAFILRSVPSEGVSMDIKVSNGYAFVSGQQWGGGGGIGRLKVFDVDPPQSAQLVDVEITPGNAWGVDVEGSYAYVADCWAGIRIYDISIPQNVSLITSVVSHGSVRSIDVDNGYAYAADSGLTIFDVDPPQTTHIAKTVDKLSMVYGAYAVGNYVYVADNVGLRVVKINPSENAHVVGTIFLPGPAHDVKVSNGYAYVTSGWGGIHIVNVAFPESPLLVRTIPPQNSVSYPLRVAISNEYAYVTDYFDHNLSIVDISPPSGAQVVHSVPMRSPYGLCIKGNYALVAGCPDTPDDGVRIVDITIPESSYIVKKFGLDNGVPFDIKSSGNYALISGSNGFTIVNLNNVFNPIIVSNIKWIGSQGTGLEVFGNTAFIADGYAKVKVINFESPNSPYVRETVDLEGSSEQLHISNGYAYVSTQKGGLKILKL